VPGKFPGRIHLEIFMRFLIQERAIVFFAVLVMATTIGLAAHAADPRHKADYERLQTSVKALSDALVREPAAAGGEAKANIAKVAARQKEAEELAAVGEYETAKSILDEGYRLLTRTLASIKSGSGYSGPSGSAALAADGDSASRKAAYERTAGSARALLDAAKRASAEAGGARGAEIGHIEAALRKAEAVAGGGDFAGGEAAAGEALKQLRPLLVTMKGGASAAASAPAPDGAREGGGLAAFDSRLATTKALVDALKRQNKDKAAGKDAEISGIESRLRNAEAARGNDLAGAQAMLDQAYKATQATLQALQTPSAMKTGSAALEAGGVTAAGSDLQRGELDRLLRSSGLLREAVARKSSEKGADSSGTLSRIDALLAEARTRQAADLSRALQAAAEANQLAKDAMAGLR
jgi:hypothetical protein